MLLSRRDESSKKTWFRSDRVFNYNGQFYFHTREGIDVGPYESQLEAEIEAEMLRELIKDAALDGESLGVLREFILESFALGRPLSVKVADGAESVEVRASAAK